VRLDSAERVMVGLLEWGSPQTGRKLAKELGMSPATVNRAIEDLIERGWVVRLDQLPVSSGYLQSLVSYSRFMPVVVNFDRPGIEQYLAFLFVEHGVSAENSRQWMESALRGSPVPRPYVAFPAPGDSDPFERLYSLLEQFGGLDDEFADMRVRDLRLRMNEVFGGLDRQENYFGKIYSASSEERARNLISDLMSLEQDLSKIPSMKQGSAPVVALPMLAVQCHRSALAIWRCASRFWDSAGESRRLNEEAIRFGERAMTSVLPVWNSAGGLSTHSALRDLAIILEWKFWGGKLNPERAVWSGGDVLLAAQLREYAIRLQRISTEIRALPALRGPDSRPKNGAAQWPLDLPELNALFGAALEGETVGEYEARIASLEAFEFVKPARIEPTVNFYAKPLPDYVKERWQEFHVSIGEVAQGDVITSIKGQELWHPVLVAKADSERLELTYGDGEQVAFAREWLTPVEDAITVYRVDGARKRKSLDLEAH